MKHTAFFGDGEKTFALTTPMILELERKTGHGIGAIFRRLQQHDYSLEEISETIRLGLIGGGTSPVEADALVKTYVGDHALADSADLAHAIMFVRFLGIAIPDDSRDEIRQPVPAEDAAKLREDIARAFADGEASNG